MYKQKLCLGLNPDFGLDTFEQLEAFKAVGFDAFFRDSKIGKICLSLRTPRRKKA